MENVPDPSPGPGLGPERYRRVRLSAIASIFSRGASFVVTIVLIALSSRYLDGDRMGLWMTIVGLTVLLSLADLGLGNGIINAVAEAVGRDREDEAAAHVSTAFFSLLAVSFVGGALFAALYPVVEWANLLNVGAPLARAETAPAMAVLVACVFVTLPLGLAQKIHFAYQEGFLASLWAGVGSGIALVIGLVAVGDKAGVPWLTLAVAGGPAFGVLLNSVALYWFRKPEIRPRPALISRRSARRLFSLGGLYFALAVAGIVGLQVDNIVIARILGVGAVPAYAIPLRLFMILPTVLSFALAPLWPAYTESIARSDIGWVKGAFERSLRLSLLVAVPSSMALVAFAPFLLDVWVGESVDPPFHLLVGLGLWAVINAVTGPLAMLLNGLGVVGFQVITSLAMGAINLTLSIILVSSIGVAGAIYGTVISLVCCIVLPASIYVAKRLYVGADAVGTTT